MCLSVPEYCYFVCEPVCLFWRWFHGQEMRLNDFVDVLFEAAEWLAWTVLWTRVNCGAPMQVCVYHSTHSWGAGSRRHALPIKSWVRNLAHLAQSEFLQPYETRPWSSDLESSCLIHCSVPLFLFLLLLFYSRLAAELPRLLYCAHLAMLACLQRRQNPQPQHPVCASKTLEPPQALGRKCKLTKRGCDGGQEFLPEAVEWERRLCLIFMLKDRNLLLTLTEKLRKIDFSVSVVGTIFSQYSEEF